MFLFPGFAAARAFDRRAGRHQRGEKLPERWRQCLPAVLRHDQGRRFSFTRSERLSAGGNRQQHHRSMRRTGRAVRARIQRVPGEPLFRRRTGFTDVLRARTDRPAAFARLLSGALPASRRRHGADVSANRDARFGDRRWTGQGNHHAKFALGKNGEARRGRGRARERRIRQRVLSLDECARQQCDRDLSRLQKRRALCKSILHPDSSDLHSCQRRLPVQAHANVGVTAQ